MKRQSRDDHLKELLVSWLYEDISEDPLIAKIQRFYDVLYFKKTLSEKEPLTVFPEENLRKTQKTEIFTQLIRDYDSIFKGILLKGKHD